MRLSEKTIELNFCAQATARLGSAAFWFGLTQRQEARAGFDAATKIGGRVILLQFKASNMVLKSGARRFHLPHGQLDALRSRARPSRQRSVFYVLPNLGETGDLAPANWDILPRSWLLDVASLGSVSRPTTRSGSLRKNKTHYADLTPPYVTIHSDPITVEAISADSFFSEGAPGADGIDADFPLEGLDTRQGRTRFLSGSVGLVLPPPPASALLEAGVKVDIVTGLPVEA